MVTCNICEGEADLENEGGVQGYIGILPFALCVWCHAGIVDMVESMCETCRGKEDGICSRGNDN